MSTARPTHARHAAPAGRFAGPSRTRGNAPAAAPRRHPSHALPRPTPLAPLLRRPALATSVPAAPPVLRSGRQVRAAVGRVVLATGAAGAVALPVVATVLTPGPGPADAEASSLRLDARTTTAAPAPASEQVAAWVTASQSVQDAAVGAQIAAASRQVAAEQAAVVAAEQAAVVAAQQADAAQQAAAVQQADAAQQAAQQRAADVAAAQNRASRSRTPLAAPAPSGDPRSIASGMLAARGWGGQSSCLDRLWTKESGWKTSADNPSSSAYGIPQALPGSKMASAGADWRTNPATQIAWGLGYIADRYGSPCAAWSHSQSVNWY